MFNEVEPLKFAGALCLSLILYTLGVGTGWHLSNTQLLAQHANKPPEFTSWQQPVSRQVKQPVAQPERSLLLIQGSPSSDFRLSSATQISDDHAAFLKALTQNQLENALLLYQQHERSNGPTFYQLRKSLMQVIDQGQSSNQGIEILEYFTQYYYDDQHLLERLAQQLEEKKEFQKALETRISARQFSTDNTLIKNQTSQIQRLARELFKQYQKQQRLEESLPVFQQLLTLEPEHSFYRFALAQSWLHSGNLDAAIQELELIESDPVFGQKARDLLAALLPSPEPEPTTTSGSIALQPWGQHFIVTTMAGRKQPLELLLDTGASVTTLPPYLLQKLASSGNARRIGQVRLSTANGLRSTNLYRVKTIQIGGYELRDLDVAELKLDDQSGADGLLGMDILGLFDFKIDQDSRTLTLISRK